MLAPEADMHVHAIEEPDPPMEGCQGPQLESPPPAFLEPDHPYGEGLLVLEGDQEGRLIAPLRELARGLPIEMLREAAIALAVSEAEQAAGIGAPVRIPGIRLHGYAVDPAIYWRACAELAVTGTRAFFRMRTHPVDRNQLELIAKQPILDRLRRYGLQRTDDEIVAALDRVLAHTYAVAWAIRGPRMHRRNARPELGWIATSSEDDPAHAPVNVGSADYPQHRITLDLDGHSHTLRYAVYSAEKEEAAQPFDPTRVPEDLPPIIPPHAEVVLFLQGHGSRLEEFELVAEHFFERAAAAGREYCVIAPDLPGRGYSTHFDHDYLGSSIERFAAHGLDLMDRAIVKFVDAIDAITPIKDRLVAVMGGSLGGNLGLRIGENVGGRVWPRSIVAWSPASTGNSMFQAGEGQELAHGPLGALAFNPPSEGRRHEFFRWIYDKRIDGLNKTNADTWYVDNWFQCKTLFIRAARQDQQEVYSEKYRRWHWRLAAEQRGWSHRDSDVPGVGESRFKRIRRRLLLLTGRFDNFPYARIHGATRTMADLMDSTPGECRSFDRTGHSIHAERPLLLARQIVKFIDCDPFSNDEDFHRSRYYRSIRAGRFGTDAADSIVAVTEFGLRVCVRNPAHGPWRVRAPESTPPNRRFWEGHPAIAVFDVDGDGRDELLARGSEGLWSFRVDPSSGDIDIHGISPRLSDTQLPGPDDEAHVTVRFGRLERRGPAIAVVRGPDGIRTFRYERTTSRFEELGTTAIFTDRDGWNAPIYYRSIALVDDGTGAHVLVGRGPSGVQTFRFNPASSQWERGTQTLVLHGAAWDQPQYADTLRFGRIAGRPILVMRGAEGIHTFSLVRETLVWSSLPHSPHLTDAQGWDAARYYRTIALADVDGDRSDNLIARGAGGLYTFSFDAARGWVALPLSPHLTDAQGWDEPEHYDTLRYARLDGERLDLVARSARGLKVFRFDRETRLWEPHGPR